MLLCRSLLLLLLLSSSSSSSSSRTGDPDYEFGDYRGRWCIDDHGFVYGLGAIYYPSPAACPCTCTEDGPVCVQPKCPRIHPRCARIRYKACCPVCEAVARVCEHRGRVYRLLQEFRLSRCERCRCEANGSVYCSISGCPAPHCVNPVYQANHCCPVCLDGPNCFLGDQVIPAGRSVSLDQHTLCYCSYRDGTWNTHPHATCETSTAPPHTAPSPTPHQTGSPGAPDSRERRGGPRMDQIP